MKKFVTIFPNFRFSHRYKDVGMIPDILGKYYECSVFTYKRNVKGERVDGLRIKYIKKVTGNEVIDTSLCLIAIAKKVDVLNLYHFTRKNLLYIFIYKLANLKGKVFLKLDANIKNYDEISKMNTISKLILKRCNIISVETKNLYNKLKKDLPTLKIRYIPNGTQIAKSSFEEHDKKNTICTVGRLGVYEKGTEVLVEAFKEVYTKLESWELHLVGPMTEEFKNYIEDLFLKCPSLAHRIKLYGELNNRDKLFDIYGKSKVFCLPSRSESFGIAAVEAMSMGCYLIVSNIISAADITSNEEIGRVFPIEDVKTLGEILIDICNRDEEFFKSMSLKTLNVYKENFSYLKICRNIKEYLEEDDEQD